MSTRWHERGIPVSCLAAILALFVAACQAPQPAPPAAEKAKPAEAAPTVKPVAKAEPTTKPAAKVEPTAAPAAKAEPAAKPKQLQKVMLSYSAATAFQSLIWVSKDKGLFEKYGLDADVQQIPTREQISAMVAGKIDIGITSADNITSAILSGADLKLIGLFVPYIEASFYTRPEIKTPEQLKGKLVGASTAGPGIQRHANEYALAKLGLDPKKDVEIRVFRTTADAFAAARAGEIHGIALFPPDNMAAEKAGFNMLYDVAKDQVLYPSGSTYTTGKFIRDKPDVVLAYLKAISEGIAVYKTDPDFAIATFTKWTKLEDREVIKAGWDWFARDMPDVPKWWPDAMKATLEALSYEIEKARTTDPTSLYDNSFVERLEKEGFYTQLAQQYPRKKS